MNLPEPNIYFSLITPAQFAPVKEPMLPLKKNKIKLISKGICKLSIKFCSRIKLTMKSYQVINFFSPFLSEVLFRKKQNKKELSVLTFETSSFESKAFHFLNYNIFSC